MGVIYLCFALGLIIGCTNVSSLSGEFTLECYNL